MAKIAGCSDWGRELCRAFGEDPNDVSSITLVSVPDAAVAVTIEKYVDSRNEKVLKTIRKVAWVEEPEETPEKK